MERHGNETKPHSILEDVMRSWRCVEMVYLWTSHLYRSRPSFLQGYPWWFLEKNVVKEEICGDSLNKQFATVKGGKHTVMICNYILHVGPPGQPWQTTISQKKHTHTKIIKKLNINSTSVVLSLQMPFHELTEDGATVGVLSCASCPSIRSNPPGGLASRRGSESSGTWWVKTWLAHNESATNISVFCFEKCGCLICSWIHPGRK